jgi:uncharacterized Zn-binding protein involved in type VI secretion
LREICKLGDANSGGGIITTIPQFKVLADMIPVCVMGSTGTGHGLGLHATDAWFTIASSKVLVNGIPVDGMGDSCTCGDVLSTGSSRVFIA